MEVIEFQSVMMNTFKYLLLSKYYLLQVYDTNEGRLIYSIDHFNEIKSMDISSDDKLLATTSFRFDDEVIHNIFLEQNINVYSFNNLIIFYISDNFMEI